MMTRLFVFLLCCFVSHLLLANTEGKVALLISGYDNPELPSVGYDLEELAQAYLILRQNGLSIDIVSPSGGAVKVKKHKDHVAYIQAFKQQTNAVQQLKNTKATSSIDAKNYDALFIVGGDGAMFDLPFHQPTQNFIKQFIVANKPIAAVCHGPAALVNIELTEHQPFVKGKQINSFTKAEDEAFSKDLLEHFPFVLQTKLEQQGANFVNNHPMLPYVTVDDNLITAQNPVSVGIAAEALIALMGYSPLPRQMFPDEASLHLVSKAWTNGAAYIDVAMRKAPHDYDKNYLGLYGFYAYDLATTEADKRRSLALMSRIASYFEHPQYQVRLLERLVEQEEIEKAKSLLVRIKQSNPELIIPTRIQELITRQSQKSSY